MILKTFTLITPHPTSHPKTDLNYVKALHGRWWVDLHSPVHYVDLRDGLSCVWSSSPLPCLHRWCPLRVQMKMMKTTTDRAESKREDAMSRGVVF